MAKEITTANFETEVLKSEKPVLIDFWATWCGPCMRQGPVVEELAEEGYAVGKVDVDQNMALAQQFRVVSIPTLIVFFIQRYYLEKNSYVTVTGKPVAGLSASPRGRLQNGFSLHSPCCSASGS